MSEHRDVLVIATVGTGRNRTDIAEALAFSIRRHQARRAVFLCSRKTAEETLPLVLERLEGDAVQCRHDVCDDEEDVQRLFIEWNRKWPEWLGDGPPARVLVDFTSGTKAMSAAAVLLAVARGADQLSYVVGRRDEGGRVVQSEEARVLSPDLIFAHRQLRLAVEHFHAGGYAAARDIAAGYLAIADAALCKVARSIHVIGAAYEAWDRFDYRAAAARLRESKRFWPQWSWVIDSARLQANEELILAAKECTEGTRKLDLPLCADLLASAERCARRSDWDDAVARLYRACEMIAQIRLFRKYQIRTGDADPTLLPENIRGPYAERKSRLGDHKLKLGLDEAYELLFLLDDPVGRKYAELGGGWQRKGDLLSALQSRNGSLLAHGVVPIGEEKAKKLHELVTALARTLDSVALDQWLAKAEPVRFGAF